MFDFFKPADAGFLIKEDKKLKFSKKEFDHIYGSMSINNYTKKVTVILSFYYFHRLKAISKAP